MLTMMPVLGLTQPVHATTDPALSITSPAVGQVIGNDGKNYYYSSLPQSVTAVAKIAYVDETNHKGLALAMTDESDTKYGYEADTAASAHTPAFTGGTWKLASKDEWDNMIKAAGGFASLRDGFSSVGGTNINMKGNYWSSTTQGANKYYIDFKNGYWYSVGQSTTKIYVRACLTFDIVTTYPLWVGGTPVTSANKDDVFNDQKVSYTPATDTSAAILKLNGYDNEGAVGDKDAAIYAEEDLIIETTGDNNVENTSTEDNTCAIWVTGDLTLQGSGTLNATGLAGIQAYQKLMIEGGIIRATGISSGIGGLTVTINNGTIEATATDNVSYGIFGGGGVTINNGQVTASGSTAGISGFVKNAIAGTGWTDTEGTEGKADIEVSAETGQDLSDYRKVQFPALVEYPLWVGGTRVTSANMYGDGWSYTPATTEGGSTTPATLKLNGYSYEGAGYENAAIYAKEDLEIELTGDNTVTATSSSPMAYDSYGVKVVKVEEDGKFLKISGNGKLTATGGKDGIRTFGDIIIDSGTVEASGSEHGIVTEPGVVRINGGTVTASGSMDYDGTGILGSGVEIKSGTVTASGGGQGIYSPSVKITDGVTSVIVSSNHNVITGIVKNAVAGTGWTNTAGTEGKADIAVSAETGWDLSDYNKVQFPAAHEHSFTYNANGATITAECSSDGCTLPNNTATLTIEAPQHTTYGDGKEEKAQITDSDGIQGGAKVSYFNTDAEGGKTGNALTSAPTGAGKYWAEITLGPGTDNKSATAHVVYTIAKATPTINTNPTASAITYGQALSASTLSDGVASVDGSFAWTTPTTKPDTAGTPSYGVSFTPNDTDNYNTVTCTVSLTVNQKEVGLSWADTKLTYNGQQQAPTATATELVSGDTGQVSVIVTGGQTNASATAYTATASGLTGEKSGNYKLPTDNTTTFTISPKSITGASVTLDKTELTFNGSSQTVNVTGVSLDGVNLDANTDYGVSGNTETNKGDYTVTVTGKDNYTGSATANWKIVAKAMTVTADPVNETYDGNEYSITVNVTDPSSGTTINYGTEAGTYDLSESPKFKDAGTHTVYFKVSGNFNYNDYTGQAAVTIAKKPVNASVSADDKKYDGNTVATVAASVSTGDLIQGDSIKITGLKGSFADKNAGEDKTVTIDSSAKSISGTGSENYEVTIPSETKASISKAAATIKAKDQSIKVGDTVPDLSDPVLDKHYTVTGLVAGDALTAAPKLAYASKPDNTKAGTYEITASDANAGGNYELSYQKGTLTISEAPAAVPTAKAVLAAKGIAKGKTALKFKWNKVSGAAKYEVWMAKCGKKSTIKMVKTLRAPKTSWTKKKLKKNTAYRFYVVAKDASGNVICKSVTGHAYTGNVRGKYTNAKSLKVKKSSFTLNKGGTAKIKATQKKAGKGKKLCNHAKLLRYKSNNTSVAKVSSSGKIIAVGAGSCTVYVQTVNGIWKTVKVTVK